MISTGGCQGGSLGRRKEQRSKETRNTYSGNAEWGG